MCIRDRQPAPLTTTVAQQPAPLTADAKPFKPTTAVLPLPVSRPRMQEYHPRQVQPQEVAQVMRSRSVDGIEMLDLRLKDGTTQSARADSLPVWRNRYHDEQQASRMSMAPSQHRTRGQPPPPQFGY